MAVLTCPPSKVRAGSVERHRPDVGELPFGHRCTALHLEGDEGLLHDLFSHVMRADDASGLSNEGREVLAIDDHKLIGPAAFD